MIDSLRIHFNELVLFIVFDNHKAAINNNIHLCCPLNTQRGISSIVVEYFHLKGKNKSLHEYNQDC